MKISHYPFLLLTLGSLILTAPKSVSAQIGLKSKKDKTVSLARNNEYIIGGVRVTGSQYLDEELLLSISGLVPGDKLKMPNDPKLSKAIHSLWKQNLFSDVQINAERFQDDKVFIEIHIEERPRLSKYNFKGVKESEAKELKEKIGLVKSRVVTEATKQGALDRIRKYYDEKGYSNVRVAIAERPDTSLLNTIILTFAIDKGQKVKINQVNIFGNENASLSKLKGQMKGSKEMARISLYKCTGESGYGTNINRFNDYVNGKGFLSLSKPCNWLIRTSATIFFQHPSSMKRNIWNGKILTPHNLASLFMN